MNGQINQLVKSLLQKESLEQCSLQELQTFADRHPYFGAAQLLLTKKLKTENSAQYDEQLQKTFLFFHNPLWVEQLLSDTGNAEIIIAKNSTPSDITENISTPVADVEEKVEVAADTIIENEHIRTSVETDAQPVEKSEEPADESPAYSDVVSMAEEKAEEPELKIAPLKLEAFDPAKAELTFEPYHTVDYFASQGINYKEEEKPLDKFGIQLKSFTAWLKTMKKLPATAIAAVEDGSSEKKVEQLAEHSIQQREIMTEAMAEVWEKQGNKAKAIEIYSKLSLLEPLKSPYFAAKIERLK
jgi:hypothetical protein